MSELTVSADVLCPCIHDCRRRSPHYVGLGEGDRLSRDLSGRPGSNAVNALFVAESV